MVEYKSSFLAPGVSLIFTKIFLHIYKAYDPWIQPVKKYFCKNEAIFFKNERKALKPIILNSLIRISINYELLNSTFFYTPTLTPLIIVS